MMRSDILELFDKHGILPTQQRVEVAEVLLVRPQHMSAECRVYQKVREWKRALISTCRRFRAVTDENDGTPIARTVLAIVIVTSSS